MEKEAKTLSAIALEDLPAVMEEVAKELGPLLSSKMSTEEQRAASTFFGTLVVTTLGLFNYLPPEQQDEILVNCVTWFDIGTLLGRSPKLLVEILERVNPRIGRAEAPNWLTKKLAGRLTSEEED